MKNWKVLASLGLAAAGALVAGIITLAEKTDESESEIKASPKGNRQSSKKDMAEGTYSFVAGYKNAATEEVSVKYDDESFSFSIVEEDFLSFSSDSHVAVMYGPDFNIQIEYADFYKGENFSTLKDTISEKFKGFAEIQTSGMSGYRYIDGDSVCYCLPAGPSYILLTVIPSKDSKETTLTLPDNIDLKQILDSITISEK